MSRLATRFLISLIRVYQATFAGILGGNCRFHPSCSEYAIAAIQQHGAARGTVHSARRLLKCGPWSRGGVDNVRSARPTKQEVTHG
ncbi:MAG: membrane protein insertion efficiency factor YidD [Actinomycetota bacterium]